MAEILTLLSGKGGSGKTTLALSLTKLLLECNLKVLLIDGDLATNGATYFFESKYNMAIQTTNDILLSKQDLPRLEVQKDFHFIPTNTHFPYSNSKNSSYDYETFINYVSLMEKEYDIVICDCQAGYSKILESILKISNVNLIVMEPDAISSSSVRVLYAQVSNLLESSKTYQIFNKITTEENKIYDKVFAGTIFTSLPSIMFNWDVRKAFAYSQVPELVTTNVEFGKNVYEVAKILFPKLIIQLKTYEEMVLLFEQEELETQIKQYYISLKKYKDGHLLRKIRQFLEPILTFAVPAYSIILALLIAIITNEHDYRFYLSREILCILLTMLSLCFAIFVLIYVKYKNKRRDEFYEIETKEREIKHLEKKLSQIKSMLE